MLLNSINYHAFIFTQDRYSAQDGIFMKHFLNDLLIYKVSYPKVFQLASNFNTSVKE